MPLLRYQVNHCTQMGLQLLLLLMLIFVAWASLTPVYEPKPELINDKLAHFLSYLAMAIIADNAFATTPYGIKKFTMLFTYGVAMEITQLFIPGRDFSLLDMLANGSGLLLYLALINTLIKRDLTPVVHKS